MAEFVPKTARERREYAAFLIEEFDPEWGVWPWIPLKRRRKVVLPADPNTLLTPPQAAQHLSVTIEQLLALVHDGTLKGINVSRGRKRGRWRFTRADLDAFKASRIAEVQPCRFLSPKNPRRTTGTASKSSVVDFSALRAARLARKPNGSKR
jgi:excisionase family DNA binding protein